MSDLIDREALRREIYKDMAIEDNKRVVQLLQAIMDAPSVDAEPVQHGRWETYPSHAYRRCSVCKTEWDKPKFNIHASYCPNCGAKMNGGSEDDHQGT